MRARFRPLTSRKLLPLVCLALAGAAASYILQTNRPIGRYVGDAAAVMQILSEGGSPQVSHGAADLTLVAFTDYQCPACRKADPAMRHAVDRDGNVRVVYKDWPVFGERSVRAAEVALAAQRQGIYPTLHHALMRAPRIDEAALQDAVEQAGGSWERIERDLVEYQPWIAGQLEQNRLQAFTLGLEGTPGYLVGPFLIKGAISEREFLRAFSQARGRVPARQ
jgi:protein-disulfide isomerase